jgi:glycosyltransferase involved in cell wall biosynthesis
MNIVFLSHYAGSPRHGMALRFSYLAREWVAAGHRVTIVAASFSHIRSQNPEVTGPMAVEEIGGVRHIWLKTPSYSENGVQRARNMLAFVCQLLRHERKLEEICHPDVVIAASHYPLDSYPAHRLARRCGARLIYEVHDLWPLTPIEVGGMSRRHPFIMLMQWAEDYAYRHCDQVVSLLPCAQTYMVSRGMAPEKFHYVPNGIDAAEWQDAGLPLPIEHTEVIERFRAEGRFIIGFAGAHGVVNALDTVVDAAKLLEEEAFGFILVGQGPERQRLQQRARDLSLTNIAFLPAIPKPLIPRLLSSMDALYLGHKRTPLYQFGISPNKLFDYMMAAKPVIQAIDAGNDPVTEAGCGITIPPEDPNAVAAAVRKLSLLTPEQRAEMGRQGRDYVVARHDYRVLAERFLSVMKVPSHRALANEHKNSTDSRWR